MLRSIIRSGLKGISVNNQPPPDPIQTQASSHIGNPTSVGKTSLGNYRMGNAVYEGMNVPPIEIKQNVAPEVKFQVTGFNVFQPTNTDVATASLIAKLGDQKTKYARNDPYAKYMAYKKLENDLKEAEKGASPNETGVLRDILRDAVEKRRTQNEQDFLRKMLDSGVSMEDAKDEIENVRRSNNQKEASLVDDRLYQSKMAIKNMANRRGVASAVLEPLSHSGAIMNPQTSELLANAGGNPERGFGNSPLDIDRLYKSPAYYKRFLRKTGLSQEQADRDAAYNNAIGQGDVTLQSLSQLPAMERATNIMNMRENVAANLDRLRNKQDKNMSLIPPTLFANNIVAAINQDMNKKPGDKVVVRPVSFQKLSPAHLLYGINYLINRFGNGENVVRLRNKLQVLLSSGGFNPNIIKTNLIQIATELTPEGSEFAKLPIFAGAVDKQISEDEMVSIARSYLKSNTSSMKQTASRYEQVLMEEIDLDTMLPTAQGEGIGVAPPTAIERNVSPSGRSQTRRTNRDVVAQIIRNTMTANAQTNNQLTVPQDAVIAQSANNAYIPRRRPEISPVISAQVPSTNVRMPIVAETINSSIGKSSLPASAIQSPSSRGKGIGGVPPPKTTNIGPSEPASIMEQPVSSKYQNIFNKKNAKPTSYPTANPIAISKLRDVERTMAENRLNQQMAAAAVAKKASKINTKTAVIGMMAGSVKNKQIAAPAPAKPELSSMFKKQLQAVAVSVGVSQYGNMKDIIARIEKSGKY